MMLALFGSVLLGLILMATDRLGLAAAVLLVGLVLAAYQW